MSEFVCFSLGMNIAEHNKNENTVRAVAYLEAFKLASEIWTQDSEDANLWHGPHGVIVNTAALEERKAFYDISVQNTY